MAFKPTTHPVGPSGPLRWLHEVLDAHRHTGLERLLSATSAGEEVGPPGRLALRGNKSLLNFSSNDYLGLSKHHSLCEAAIAAIEAHGWGAGSARLICGHHPLHEQLERRLALFKRRQAALVYPSGYATNLGVISALMGDDDLIFLDKLNHASLIDGARLSGASVRIYPHNGLSRLEHLLQRLRVGHQKCLIVSDTVFSMEGDLADLPALSEMAQRFDAMLMVDEAHATGIWGDNGRGMAEHQGVEDHVDIVVGTLSKALGGVGGYVAGSQELIDYLINFSRPFMYTTGSPAAAAAAGCAALDVVAREPHRRQRLVDCANRVRQQLCADGWNIGNSATQIIPLVVGSPEHALALARHLENRGILAVAIRPPSVPPAASRLRLSISCQHSDQDFARLYDALREVSLR